MPRKGYKRQAGRSVGMPERMEAQNFNRRISANEALILATAGDGSKTDGFRNLLSLYRELHNIGYRCREDIEIFISRTSENKLKKNPPFIVNKWVNRKQVSIIYWAKLTPKIKPDNVVLPESPVKVNFWDL